MPIWSEVSKGLSSDIVSVSTVQHMYTGSLYECGMSFPFFPRMQTFPDFSFGSLPLSVDTWFKEAVQELILIESEWQPVDIRTK